MNADFWDSLLFRAFLASRLASILNLVLVSNSVFVIIFGSGHFQPVLWVEEKCTKSSLPRQNKQELVVLTESRSWALCMPSFNVEVLWDDIKVYIGVHAHLPPLQFPCRGLAECLLEEAAVLWEIVRQLMQDRGRCERFEVLETGPKLSLPATSVLAKTPFTLSKSASTAKIQLL